MFVKLNIFLVSTISPRMILFFCSDVSACKADFKAVEKLESALKLPLSEFEKMPTASQAAKKIFDAAQGYLAAPNNFIAQRDAEEDPDAPPCTLVDSSQIPNIRKFSHLTAAQRDASNQSSKKAASKTESRCPMGFTGTNPHASSSGSTAAGGKCPVGFGRREAVPKPPSWMDLLKSSDFWIQALGGLAVSGIVALAIAKGRAEQSL
jgi:hypothetical protein